MKNRLAITLALGLSATAVARASAPLSVGPAAVGDTLNYRIDFKGTFWNGEPKAFVHDTALTLKGDDMVHAVITQPEVGQPLQIDEKRAPDGTIQPAEQMSGYDTIARIVHAAPASFSVGSTWPAAIPVPMPGGSTTDIPVVVRIAAVEGDNVTLQATGNGNATGRLGTFEMPLDLSIALAARFAAGRFERLDYRASEVVHAGPQTQTMAWNYSLVAR